MLKTKTKKTLGVIYARYSSHNQRDVSIEQQVNACRKFAEENEITIIAVYDDHAKSGKTDRRPQFQKMMKAAERGEFDVVIAWKSDRLGRNMLQAMMNESKLDSCGVNCMYIEENFGDTAAGRFAARNMMNVNQFYIENLAENVRRGLYDNAEKCLVTNGLPPFGYKIVDKKYAIDTEKAVIVQEIFRRVAEGETNMSIARDLNARGIKTQRGGEWGRSSFHVMLSNERYRGIYIYNDIRVEGGIPRIIDDQLFYKVQEAVKMNKQGPGSRRAGTDYLLTGKLYCGKCGSPMTGIAGTSHTGKMHYYYACTKKRNEKTCDKKNVVKEDIEIAVAKAIREYALNDDSLDNISDMILEYNKKQAESNEIDILKDRLAENEKATKNILKAIEAGIFNNTTQDRLLELEAEQEELKRTIKMAEATIVVTSKEKIIEGLKFFREVDFGNRRALQRLFDTFLVAVYVFDDELKICFSFSGNNNTAKVSLKDVSSAGAAGSSCVASAPPTEKTARRGGFFCCKNKSKGFEQGGSEAEEKPPVEGFRRRGNERS
ncbi:MAG: recombinase family protein, partial [Acutalibacteraceae bacterium]